MRRRSARSDSLRSSLLPWASAVLVLAYVLWGCGDRSRPAAVEPGAPLHVGEWLAADDALDVETRERYREWFGENCGPGPYPECDRCGPERACVGVRYGSFLVSGRAEGAMFTAFCGDAEARSARVVPAVETPSVRDAVVACMCAGGEFSAASRNLCEIQALRTFAELRSGRPDSSQYLAPRTIRCGPRREPGVAFEEYERSCLAPAREAFPGAFP